MVNLYGRSLPVVPRGDRANDCAYCDVAYFSPVWDTEVSV